MYNMVITLFGVNFNIELIILGAIIYLIIVTHTLCGCSRVGLLEGLSMLNNGVKDIKKKLNKKEGFSSNIFSNEPSSYKLGNYDQVNTTSWFQPDLAVYQGKPLSAGVTDILNREKQDVPLGKSELLMFNNTPFKPECCPSTYSNSDGCACITTNQYNYLIERGGNNIPYSEY